MRVKGGVAVLMGNNGWREEEKTITVGAYV